MHSPVLQRVLSMKSSLFKNLRLQTYLQIANTIIPIITTPYIARVLGASMIGVFSSAHATASFFTLFAVLGTTNYGTRCLSAESDVEKKKVLFFEIYCLQLITSLIATLCYLFYCVFLADNKLMAYLQLITLLGCFIEISWFYFGLEEFKATVTTSMVIRIISVVFLFVLVKSKDDLWIYAVIMLVGPLVSQLILWCIIIKKGYLGTEIPEIKRITRHLFPNLKLFIPILAMTVCNSTDKVMLGTLSTYEQTGFYSNIDRVINVPFSIFSGISTVFLPRITSICSENKERAKAFFIDTLSGIIMLGVAISFGIIAVSDYFIPLFLGPGYEECVFLINVFAPIIIIKCISNAIRLHYLVPFREESIYIKATCIGAVLNIVLNYVLISKSGALGAVLATLISETIVLIIQIVLSLKFSELISTYRDLLAYLCFGVVMTIVIRCFKFDGGSVFLKLIIDVFIGAFVYGVMTFIYWIISGNLFYSNFIRPKIKSIVNINKKQ